MLQTYDILITIFLQVAMRLAHIDRKHSQGKLWVSEIVTIGILWVLSGKSFRKFYRWLKRERYFPDLPERSRMTRLLAVHKDVCNEFLDTPTFFNTLDSFGVEVIHPIRESRSEESKRVSKKGKSNHRWIVGRKICISFNGKLRITGYADDTDNVPDNTFNNTFETDTAIHLTDFGFRKKDKPPTHFKICQKGTWNERMVVETVFSLWTRMCNMKKSFHRSVKGFKAKVAYLIALTNNLFDLNVKLGYNEFSLVNWSI